MIVRGVRFPPVAERVAPGQVFLDYDSGRSESVRIAHSAMDRRHAEGLNRSMSRAIGCRRLPFYFEPKTYCVMWINGAIWMSDHPAEVFESAPAVENARGDVFVAGLGLGTILPPMLARDEVRSVTVLERSLAVRRLVAKHYAAEPKLEIVAGDAWTWEPPRRFDSIWLDIWEDSAQDRIPEVVELCRRWRSFRNAGAWLGAWDLAQMRILHATQSEPDNDRKRLAIIQRWGGHDVLGAMLAKDWIAKFHKSRDGEASAA